MKIQNVSDAAFKKYGKVITGLDCSDIIAAMAETPCPENVVYVPGAESLESCASAKDIAYTLYGGMPVQIGYCNGNNHKLNGLEYTTWAQCSSSPCSTHRSSLWSTCSWVWPSYS